MKRSWMTGFLLALLVSTPVVAQDPPPEAGITDLDTYESIRRIFGVDATSAETILAGAETTAIGDLAQIINFAALIATIVLIIITAINAAIQTAHEGELMGRRYNSMWVPLRSTLAVIYLAPLPGGYSLLQLSVLLLASLGGDLADVGYQEVVDRSVTKGYLGVPPPVQYPNAFFQSLYESALCAERLVQGADAYGLTDAQFQTNTDWPITVTELVVDQYNSNPQPGVEGGNQVGFRIDGAEGSGLPQGVCGGVILEPPKVVADGNTYRAVNTGGLEISDSSISATPEFFLYKERGILMQRLLLEFRHLASWQINPDIYRSSFQRGRPPYPYNNQIYDYGQDFNGLTFARAFADMMRRFREEDLRTIIFTLDRYNGSDEAQRRGIALENAASGSWMEAGVFYWAMASRQAAVWESVQAHFENDPMKPLSVLTGSRQDIGLDMEVARSWLETYSGADFRGEIAAYALTSPQQGNANPNAAMIACRQDQDFILDWKTMDIMEWIETCMSAFFLEGLGRVVDVAADAEGGDPVLAIQDAGHTMLLIAEAGIVASLYAKNYIGMDPSDKGLMRKGAEKIAEGITGLDSIDAALATLKDLLVGLTFAMGYVILLLIGLAYYLPMLPYILWVFGIFGWLLSLLEAIAVGPLWAAAHANPDGDGWAGNQASRGYLLVITVVARPVLMLVGLFGGMLIMHFAAAFVSQTMLAVAEITTNGQAFGIVSLLVYLTIYVALMIALARRAFGLIHFIPDRVLSFIGNGQALGEAQGESDTVGYLVAGASIARGGAQSVAQSGVNRVITPRS